MYTIATTNSPSYMRVSLTSKPFMLSKPLREVLNHIDRFLFASENKSVSRIYKAPHRKYKTTKDFSVVYTHVEPVAAKEAAYWTTIKRALLTSLWLDTTKEVIAHVASACANDVDRARHCPPMGFRSKGFPCRSSICPNCYMRDVAVFSKQLQTLKPLDESKVGFIVELQVPFADTIYGYDCEALQFPQLDIKAAFGTSVTPGMCGKTIGARVDSSKPYLCTNYFAAVNVGDQDIAYKKIKTKLKKMLEKNLNLQATVRIVPDIESLAGGMFNHCPFSLITSSTSDLSSLTLHYTVESYRTKVANKKTYQIF
jgi:hypothetical protein